MIWDEIKFKQAVMDSTSIASVIKKMGVAITGTNYRKVRKLLNKLGLNCTHFLGKSSSKINGRKRRVILNEEMFIANSPYSRGQIKKRILNDCLLENNCSICGILPIWNNLRLVLVLDHINGVRDDYRLENLRLLCPNCNSQQSTFAGRNIKKVPIEPNKCKNCNNEILKTSIYCVKCVSKNQKRKVERPSKEELGLLIKDQSFLSIGKRYGVSGNCIVKWCKAYGLPHKSNFNSREVLTLR